LRLPETWLSFAASKVCPFPAMAKTKYVEAYQVQQLLRLLDPTDDLELPIRSTFMKYVRVKTNAALI
jgi:hypothetical protein